MSRKASPPQQPGNTWFPGNNTPRFWVAVSVVVALLVLLIIAVVQNRPDVNSVTLNVLVEHLENGNVRSITVQDDTNVLITLADDSVERYYKSATTDLYEQLARLGVDNEALRAVQFSEVPGSTTGALLLQLVGTLAPILLIGFFLFRMVNQVRGNQDQAMSFGRVRARTQAIERPQVQFSDVAGADEAKEELKEVVEFLREPEKFIVLGARIPKGVLLSGPPGTGKTLMARAVAGEAGVPFFHISGSEFVEMFVGVGASRVRDLFERAKAESPAIVFVDEIDAVGRHRGSGMGGGHDEREQTLNQILVEMDGFETGTNVIVIAATNRPDILDPALLRPGRFDRKVTMDAPDLKGRLAILGVHTRGKPIAADVSLEAVARITPGFSGADLENLVNEAAILTARRNRGVIGMAELQESMERVVMGPERRTRVMTAKEKRSIAYHEAGHAVLHHLLPHADPVHKVTIVPRGRAGGYVMSLPEGDVMLRSREAFEDQIAAAMGGRAAEELAFNQVTTGASGDLQQATQMARDMLTRYGMSSALGPRTFGGASLGVWGRGGAPEERDYSEQTAQAIDAEVKRIVTTAYERAVMLLRDQRDRLDLIAAVLMEAETLERAEFEHIMRTGERLPAPVPAAPTVPLPASPRLEMPPAVPPALGAAPAMFELPQD